MGERREHRIETLTPDDEFVEYYVAFMNEMQRRAGFRDSKGRTSVPGPPGKPSIELGMDEFLRRVENVFGRACLSAEDVKVEFPDDYDDGIPWHELER